MNEPIEIPNKSSFKINEVCALTNVKSYVLRFWESEFVEISPLVSSSGMKLYSTFDIEAILLIKKLLFDDKLTIERAKLEIKLIMPKISLVESNFSDFEEEDDIELSSIETTPFTHSSSQTKRVLIETDIQKLVMAKNKLSEILAIAEVLKQKNNWH
jgi:DNA-binding transcriptional MerR regulator